ncbi:hypothetical protein CCACVL1_20343 [Corchorus capsularis]|uniref:Uncharacterized protein n=1 Tax=Corchorus capsularis TaxID=210143 RepID=A0A1R3HBQ2_COCAP|nr:hypothetical protein CCACVL1_20343 [Corchorus capsularis]
MFTFSSQYDQPSYSTSGFFSSNLFAASPSAAATPSKQMGYVRSDKVYLVRDNLMLEPMSYTTSNMLLKAAGSPEEKPVTIDYQKGLQLVKAIFESETVLTDVFLKK